MSTQIIILLTVIILIVLIFIATYNKLVKLRVNVEEGFATMDVHLKKRYDLIPNLVEAIKGYEAYESSTLKEVIEARSQAMAAQTSGDVIEANQVLSSGLGKLIALAESYPDLKANTTYLNLQTELSEAEDDIANARLYYNGTVKIFNKNIIVFPTVLIAGMLGFVSYKFYEATSSERESIKINLRD